ncbi:hypothetical protein [Halalkalibacter krulwichiae]|uniref:Uncharacterized protein n=1 Tax=Halalkalibacter krulwichiae TaxID=199441 RepID=A0A1X9MEJ8_9BACI|nr:hypothetical protein [Halalkalibacter krulwichiae]ARK31869.1 hypothetical protein BkAM31D_19630 [Halalkalibacter krulwichiae]
MVYQRKLKDVYRPTVRYDASYRDYVNDLFRATKLDRNQLIRAALFIAAHSDDYATLLKPYMKDVPMPRPKWSVSDHAVWLEQSPVNREEGRDVTHGGEAQIRREEKPVEVRRVEQESRRVGEVHQVRQPNGGIKLFIQ